MELIVLFGYLLLLAVVIFILVIGVWGLTLLGMTLVGKVYAKYLEKELDEMITYISSKFHRC